MTSTINTKAPDASAQILIRIIAGRDANKNPDCEKAWKMS